MAKRLTGNDCQRKARLNASIRGFHLLIYLYHLFHRKVACSITHWTRYIAFQDKEVLYISGNKVVPRIFKDTRPSQSRLGRHDNSSYEQSSETFAQSTTPRSPSFFLANDHIARVSWRSQNSLVTKIASLLNRTRHHRGRLSRTLSLKPK